MSESPPAGYNEMRRVRSFEVVDNMSHDLRECVHEFGLPIVTACLKVTRNPTRIRELVREIWAGARQPTQRTSAHDTLDWILIQAGAAISAATLRRFFAENNIAIVPTEPTTAMVEASMAEVADFTLKITKRDKHGRRLRAALKAGMRESLRKKGEPRALYKAEA